MEQKLLMILGLCSSHSNFGTDEMLCLAQHWIGAFVRSVEGGGPFVMISFFLPAPSVFFFDTLMLWKPKECVVASLLLVGIMLWYSLKLCIYTVELRYNKCRYNDLLVIMN